MATFIEYPMPDGTSFLIEAEDAPEAGLLRVARDPSGNVIAAAERSFEQALAGVRKATQALYEQLRSLAVDEISITFGLKTVGEMGLFAVGKAGAEANFQVSLKWRNQTS